jgi:hypothetical protein
MKPQTEHDLSHYEKHTTFIIKKTKQATIFKNGFIYRLILAIVCTMVKVHQSTSFLGRGCSQNAENQRGRRTRSSYIKYHGQTTQQLFSFYHSEPTHLNPEFAIVLDYSGAFDGKLNKLCFYIDAKKNIKNFIFENHFGSWKLYLFC